MESSVSRRAFPPHNKQHGIRKLRENSGVIRRQERRRIDDEKIARRRKTFDQDWPIRFRGQNVRRIAQPPRRQDGAHPKADPWKRHSSSGVPVSASAIRILGCGMFIVLNDARLTQIGVDQNYPLVAARRKSCKTDSHRGLAFRRHGRRHDDNFGRLVAQHQPELQPTNGLGKCRHGLADNPISGPLPRLGRPSDFRKSRQHGER